MPHPPPIHTNPEHRPQLSDVFVHAVSEANADTAYQIWVLSDADTVDNQLSWVVVTSPHTTVRPGIKEELVLSFNTSVGGAPTPTWVKPTTARRHPLPRLYPVLRRS